MDPLVFDTALREAAYRQVLHLVRVHGNEIPWAAIAEGFALDGRRWHLASKAEGIYTPAGHPAALSVKTIVPRRGRENPYNDELASDAEVIRYAYKAHGGPDCKANRALREAMRRQLPLVYFWGLAPGLYAAVLPVFVVGDDRAGAFFHLAPGAVLGETETPRHVHAILQSEPERGYVPRLVRQRLHQRGFRHLVLDAYGHRCAMCSIHFDEFLEAAHILPDRDERGRPEVRNGMALCSLHHGAFDRHLVDVTDDYRVELSPALRRRRDGPIFQGAFLERHGKPLNLPQRSELRPGLDYLQARREQRPASLWTP